MPGRAGKKIIVEWFRYDKEGATCCRCGDSTDVVRRVVDAFGADHSDCDIELREYLLDEEQIDSSNSVKINGRDIMDILGEKQRPLTPCQSCTDLIGREISCNTYLFRGRIYEALPDEMLKEALYREAFGESPPKRSQKG